MSLYSKSKVVDENLVALLAMKTTVATGGDRDDDYRGFKHEEKPPGFDYDARRQEKCGRTLACGHLCEDPAFWGTNKCGMCRVVIDYRRPCGHTVSLYCGRGKPTRRCNRQCQKMLNCGHQCMANCGSPLCGIGTCGGIACVRRFPQLHQQLVSLKEQLAKNCDKEFDFRWD